MHHLVRLLVVRSENNLPSAFSSVDGAHHRGTNNIFANGGHRGGVSGGNFIIHCILEFIIKV